MALAIKVKFKKLVGWGLRGLPPNACFCPKGETSNRAIKNFDGTDNEYLIPTKLSKMNIFA